VHHGTVLDPRIIMSYCRAGKYQTALGSHCANCKGSVQAASLGKYCVRFGYDIKQFCCSTCLEEFKKGLKVCSYCQKDISSGAEGFLAPVGDKGQFKVCVSPSISMLCCYCMVPFWNFLFNGNVIIWYNVNLFDMLPFIFPLIFPFRWALQSTHHPVQWVSRFFPEV